MKTYLGKIPESKWFREIIPSEQLPRDFSPSVKNWLGKVVGIDTSTQRSWTQVDVWGMSKANRHGSDGEKHGPIFRTYIDAGEGSPRGGVIFSVESWRSGGDNIDFKYPGIPLTERPAMSEHTWWAWQDARAISPGGAGQAKNIEFMASGMINNPQVRTTINAARADPALAARMQVAGRGTSFEITPADGKYWNELAGSSAGGPRIYTLTDRHADVGDLRPVKAYIYENAGDDTYFVIWQVAKV